MGEESRVAYENRKFFTFIWSFLIGILVIVCISYAFFHNHNIKNPRIECYDGVEYLFFVGDGVTPHYNSDGSIKQCKK